MGAPGPLHASDEHRLRSPSQPAGDAEVDEAYADLRAFIGPNADAYLAAPSRRTRWKGSVAGVFAPAAFFLYRRMYAVAAATVLLPWLTSRLFHMRFLPILVVGCAGRALYLAIARRKVAAIRRSTPDIGEARRRMAAASGIDVPAAWLGGVILVALAISLGALQGHPPVTGAATPAPPQPGWPITALLLALLPGAILAAVLLRAGAGRISASTLATMAALGAMVATVPGALSILEALLRPRMSPMQDALATSFVFAGLFEEGAKLWMGRSSSLASWGRATPPASSWRRRAWRSGSRCSRT